MWAGDYQKLQFLKNIDQVLTLLNWFLLVEGHYFLIYDVAITTLKLRSLQDVARIFVQILVLLEICHTQQYLK